MYNTRKPWYADLFVLDRDSQRNSTQYSMSTQKNWWEDNNKPYIKKQIVTVKRKLIKRSEY